MCDVAERLEKMGIEKGLKQGIGEGIKQGIKQPILTEPVFSARSGR